MVVEPAQDLGVGAVGEREMGEVGLPALVGLFGFEADVRDRGRFVESATMSSGWFRNRWIVAWNAHPMGVFEMPADRRRSRVEAVGEVSS